MSRFRAAAVSSPSSAAICSVRVISVPWPSVAPKGHAGEDTGARASAAWSSYVYTILSFGTMSLYSAAYV